MLLPLTVFLLRYIEILMNAYNFHIVVEFDQGGVEVKTDAVLFFFSLDLQNVL